MDSGVSAVAYKVKEAAAREIELAARPFDRFHPDATVWWLIPSGEWPAFKFGKLFFDTELPTMVPDADSIFCGFYIEKGLGAPLSAIRGYNPSWIMGPDWLWEEFVDSLRSIFPPLPDGTFVSIYASFFPPQEERGITDPVEGLLTKKQAFKGSWALFTVENGTKLRLYDKELNPANPEIEEHFRDAILPATEITDIAAPLLRFPQSDWMWIDLCIGQVASRDTRGEELWSQHLKSWLPWLRSA